MAQPSHILLVDDDPAHIALIRRAFDARPRKTTVLHIATDLRAARQVIKLQPLDLILADYRLPDGDGLDLIHDPQRDDEIPIVIMTSQGSEQLVVETLKAGALDYVVKSAETLANMPHVVERAIREWQHVLERRRAERMLQVRVKQQAEVARISQLALSSIDIGPLLKDAAAIVAQTLAVDFSIIVELTRDNRLMPHAGVGWEGGPLAAGDYVLELSALVPCGYALLHGEPVIVDDVRADPRFSSAELLRTYRLVSGLSVIIPGYGALGAFSREARYFSPDDLHFAQGIANALASAIERERSAEALKRERDFRAHVMDTLGQGLTVTNAKNEFEYVNPAYARLIGRTTAEIIGRTPFDFTVPDDHPTLESALEARKNGDVTTYETRLLHTDGSIVPVLVTGVPNMTNGVFSGSVTVITDITAQKEADRQALHLAIERRQVEILREFIGNISHDLKTPLTIINTSLYLLRRIDDPARQRQKLDTIEEQARLLQKIIQDTLTMSRLDHEETFRLEPAKLHCVVNEAVDTLSATAERKSITIDVTSDETMSPVSVNSSQIYRAIVNILENALNYSNDSSVIRVRTYADGEHAVVEVTDEGIGISDTEIPLIFDRFHRADKARSMVEGGSGLGLSIAQKIVTMHTGRIEVESQLGTGTTFRIILPLTDDTSSQQAES